MLQLIFVRHFDIKFTNYQISISKFQLCNLFDTFVPQVYKLSKLYVNYIFMNVLPRMRLSNQLVIVVTISSLCSLVYVLCRQRH